MGKKLLPISFPLLVKLLDLAFGVASQDDAITIRAMMLILYLGCLRISEILKCKNNSHALKASEVRFICEHNVIVTVKSLCYVTSTVMKLLV